LLPREVDHFSAVQALSDQLVAERGYGFGGVVLDDCGRAITPPWVNANSVALDSARETIAVGATVSHSVLGFPLALDLGARNGRNLSQWNGEAPQGLIMPNENLFLGDVKERWLEMAEIAGEVCSLDINPAGTQVAVLEWWGSGIAALSVADLPSGRRRLLTTLEGIMGGEQVRLSPNASWVLVPRWKDPCLIDLESGTLLELPFSGPVSWWPSRSPGSLMIIDHSVPGEPRLCAYDLTTATLEHLSTVRLPEQPDLPADRKLIAEIEVSADGQQVLCMTWFGPSARHQLEHGSRPRVSLFDIDALEVNFLSPAFVDSRGTLEREHRAVRWLDRPPPSSFALAPELEARLTPATNALGQPNFEFAGQDAHDLAVYGLRAMVGENGSGDPHILLPEVLRCLIAMRDWMPSALDDVREWIDDINKHFFFAGLAGGMPAPTQDGWRNFGMDGR
jgi:hypothetical protein